ncbi:hypothetical protein [Rickettsia endosymbiont of Halotydeus destructor]|uniref:hypothetical protein n=1 Tax=Rickettsia endosymbiont of Halotydeus destructor TaxID=2996754 RepID=UPI003BB1E8B2
MIKNILLIIMVIQLVGCTTFSTPQWYKQGATQQELSEVNYICLKDSQQYQTRAGSTYNGATNNYYYSNSANAYSTYKSGMVTNKVLFNACMNAHGFYFVYLD